VFGPSRGSGMVLVTMHGDSMETQMSRQARVLVVDDDKNILAAFAEFLKGEHYEMVPASSAEEAEDILKNSWIDVLVTDIRLKAKSGVTLFLDVKHHDRTMPVIVVSGYPDLISESEVKTIGADFYFVKPLDLQKLRDALRLCLSKQRRH
jgi:DNA-binding NtrC family response regulator